MYKFISCYVASLLLFGCATDTAEKQASDNVGITKNFFGFGSVENAITELSSLPGAEVRKTDDRTVINIEAERVKWEFPSESGPYYPSVIKSQVSVKDGQLDYRVFISCGAEQSRCSEMRKSYAAHVEDVKNRFAK